MKNDPWVWVSFAALSIIFFSILCIQSISDEKASKFDAVIQQVNSYLYLENSKESQEIKRQRQEFKKLENKIDNLGGYFYLVRLEA